jgi:hypothetical protein
MKISTHTTRQLVQAIALAIVVAGLAVPAAGAGSGQISDVFSRAVARHQALPDWFERYAASHPYGAGLADGALPAGEPKNETPFTRAAIERPPAQVAATTRASQGSLIQGERKNQLPFTRAVTSSSVASGLSPGTGEAKNQAPFTRSATAQPQTIAAHTSSGFPWGNVAIALAAIALALALAGTSMFARSSRTHESSPAH